MDEKVDPVAERLDHDSAERRAERDAALVRDRLIDIRMTEALAQAAELRRIKAT